MDDVTVIDSWERPDCPVSLYKSVLSWEKKFHSATVFAICYSVALEFHYKSISFKVLSGVFLVYNVRLSRKK